MSTSPANPRQITLITADYQELLHDRKNWKALAEFVAKYRFFTLQEPPDTAYRTTLYDCLYKDYILPIHKQLEITHNSSNVEARMNCFRQILKNMTSDLEYNDNWAASLLAASYRTAAPVFQLPYRHLFQEEKIYKRKHLNAFLKKENNSPINITRNIFNDEFHRLRRRDDYVSQHLPLEFLKDQRPIYLSFALTMIISSWLTVKIVNEGDLPSSAYLVFIPVLFATMLCVNTIAVYANAVLPSYLELDRLPNHMGEGLLNEIHEKILEKIDLYTRQLPIRTRKPADPPSKKSPTVPETTTAAISSVPDATTHTEKLEDKTPKKKTRAPFASLTYSTPRPAPIYRWQTKFGEITYQPGRVGEVFPLWSAERAKDPIRQVVLFPRKHLEQKADKRMISAFWRTACFGHIVRHENQAGFVKISAEEKEAGSYKLPINAQYKIKIFGEFARNRMPVVPCDTDKDIELLIAERPVQTH